MNHNAPSKVLKAELIPNTATPLAIISGPRPSVRRPAPVLRHSAGLQCENAHLVNQPFYKRQEQVTESGKVEGRLKKKKRGEERKHLLQILVSPENQQFMHGLSTPPLLLFLYLNLCHFSGWYTEQTVSSELHRGFHSAVACTGNHCKRRSGPPKNKNTPQM